MTIEPLPHYSDMSPEQAREVFDQFVTVETPRWSRWLVERSGLVDAAALDGTDADLVRVWSGVVEEWRRSGLAIDVVDPGDEAEPLLARIGGGGWVVGSRWVRLASGIGAFVGDWLVRHRNGTWVLTPSKPGVAEGNEVCVSIPGGRGILPFSFATICLRQLMGGIAQRDQPESLRDAVGRYLPAGWDESAAEPEWSLERVASGRWSVMFDDVVAHEEEERVEAFAEALAARDGVGGVLHEDRELIYFDSELDIGTLRVMVADAWAPTTRLDRR